MNLNHCALHRSAQEWRLKCNLKKSPDAFSLHDMIAVKPACMDGVMNENYNKGETQ